MKQIENTGYEIHICTGDLVSQLAQNISGLMTAFESNSNLTAALIPFIGVISCIDIRSPRTKLLVQFIQNSLKQALCEAIKLIPKEKLGYLRRAKLKYDLRPISKTIVIDLNFFSKPGASIVSSTYLDQLCTVLESIDAELTDEIQQIRIEWPRIFSLAVSEEWSAKSEYFDELSNDSICGPMQKYLDALDYEAEYKRKLCSRITEGLYDGCCTIDDIYIDLNATFHDRQVNPENKTTCKIENELIAWGTNEVPGMVVVEGDPGSGKSTVLKMVANKLVRCGKHVVYIELYKLPFSTRTDCLNTLKEHLASLSWYDTLDIESNKNTVYIIDGLDEIKSDVWENAKNLTQQLILSQLCSNQKVIISGRLKIISYCADELERCNKYTILPLDYICADSSANNLREELWGKLVKVFHLNISMDNLLKQDHLEELSGSPLLLFLLAWTFDKDPISLEKVNNSVQLYRLILKCVYERQYNRSRAHYAGSTREFASYLKILRAVGTCAWLNNSREIEISSIKEYCRIMNLTAEYSSWFEEETRYRTSRLFLLFFAHENQTEDDVSTFEFLHKSFYEYLSVEEIMYQIKNITKLSATVATERLWRLLSEHDATSDSIFDFMEDLITEDPDNFQIFSKNLRYIFELIDPSKTDLTFLFRCREIPLFKDKTLNKFMEKLDCLRRNLWRLVCYILTTTKNYPNYIKLNQFSFQGMKFEYQKICVFSLPAVDFQGCTFSNVTMEITAMKNSCWDKADLTDCIFPSADFDNSSFKEVQVVQSSFQAASFQNTKICNSKFYDIRFEAVYLCESIIQDNIFEDCNFTAANFDEAKIFDCTFERCFFDRADLTDVVFCNCKFIDCSFLDAKLSGVALKSFNLSDPSVLSMLREANLNNADWDNVSEEEKLNLQNLI